MKDLNKHIICSFPYGSVTYGIKPTEYSDVDIVAIVDDSVDFSMYTNEIYEYICSLGLGLLAFIYLLVSKKLTIAYGIDCFLGSFLIMNMISSIIKYVKTKDKAYLTIMLATISIFLSDLSIAIAALSKNIAIINTFSLIVWPTYILGCILLNSYYTLKKNELAL